jgi:GWxTD domain-containing protein
MQPAISVLLLFMVLTQTFAQPLRDMNFSHWYQPERLFSLSFNTYFIHDRPRLFFRFTTSTSSRSVSEFSIAWEVRQSLSDREGRQLPEPEWIIISDREKSGWIALEPGDRNKFIVARVIYSAARKPIFYYRTILPSPVAITDDKDHPVVNNFVRINDSVKVLTATASRTVTGLYYAMDFPPAAPPFAMKQAAVPKVIKPDSLFTIEPGQTIRFPKSGLYLLQTDTTSAEGLCIRAEDDYPKLSRIETLAGPMVYVCEKKEIDRLRAAKDDKLQFDKALISILGSTDRARTFMRSYFRRVEQANTLFTSYKEGWKTDRGMIYIIFGPPDEVYLTDDREIWEYTNNTFRGRFMFVRSATLFDPDNFVLIRDRKFSDKWYEMVDLWRKARF